MIDILSETANASKMLYKPELDDFEKDGLIYCGKCKTPRQVVLDNGRKVFCNCECRAREYEEQERAFKEEKKKRAIERRRAYAFNTSSMAEWTFENAKEGYNDKLQNTAKKYTEEFLKSKGKIKGLLMFGETGVGKSYASACIVNKVINNGYTAMMRTISSISRELQADYEGQQEILDELARVDLLVIDDIGTERNTPYMNEIKYEIIDRRAAESKPMIITTNLDREALTNVKDIEGQRIFSRFFGACLPIKVEGKDLRRKILIDSAKDMQQMLGIDS